MNLPIPPPQPPVMPRPLAPRPLALHLALASQICTSSLPASKLWRQGLLPWSENLSAQAAALKKRLDACFDTAGNARETGGDPAATEREFMAALAAAAAQKLTRFIQGIQVYRTTELPADPPAMPVFWPVPVPPPADAATDAAPDPTQSRPDATTAAAAPCLRNYAQTRQFGRCQGKKPILVIPSLINRANILDLSEDNSFMRHLAAKLADRDYAPFLLDWGEPGATERHYDLADYVRIPLAQALASLDDISRPRARATPQPVTVMGYCMGGVLALALALRHPDRVRNLVLLATPWDVHADAALQHRMQPIFPWLHYWLAPWLRPGAALPVDVLQSLFFAVDPMLSLKKFTALAQTYEAQTGQAQSGQSQTYLSQEENLEKRRQFARVEDWVNNGMVLAGPVAQECLFGWYRDNDLAGLRWKIDGQTIDPKGFPAAWGGRCLAVIPHNDRIVPPESALALAEQLPACTIFRPRLGHVSMMASPQARAVMWDHVVAWLRDDVPV